MKNIKLFVAAVLLTLSLSFAGLGSGLASAYSDGGLLDCYLPDVSFSEEIKVDAAAQQPICDLGIVKEVKINDGSFVQADSAADAAQAKVGDTITWRITVQNKSTFGLSPYGNLTVNDVVPAGVSVDSVVDSTGGTYTDNNWTFSLYGNLDATLTITGKATSAAGLIVNTATLSLYTCGDDCLDPPFTDDQNDNNTNSAYVNISAVPVAAAPVLPTPPATGFGVAQASTIKDAASFTLAATGAFALAYVTRRFANKYQ